jgi:hypothetical protein
MRIRPVGRSYFDVKKIATACDAGLAMTAWAKSPPYKTEK